MSAFALLFVSAGILTPLGDGDALFHCIGGARAEGTEYAQVPETLDKAFSFRVTGLRSMFDSAEIDNEIMMPSGSFAIEGDWPDSDGPELLRVNSEYDQISLHGAEFSLYVNEPLAKGWVVAAAYNRVTNSDDHTFVCHAKLGWDADISDYNSQELGE